MPENSTGWIDIDLEEDGKRSGWVFMPQSVNSNGWGCVRLPICVLKNGSGPTVLLMAGNHGDEFEGQVGLPKFYRETDPGNLRGRIIILPSANYPACEAGERVSPVDDVNLNRAFPGKAHGTLTERIAHFINHALFPLCDWHVDIHSGGKSDDFVPVVVAYLGDDEASNKRAVEGVKLLGMPYYLAQKVRSSEVSFASAGAVGQGVISLGGEFGGGGGLSKFGLNAVEEGLPRLLKYIGILEKSVPVAALKTESQSIAFVPSSKYPYAPHHGIFESYVELGDFVSAGDICGVVHGIDDPSAEPTKVAFIEDGLVLSLRHIRSVTAGSGLAALATIVSEK